MKKYYLGLIFLLILDRFLKIYFLKTLPVSGSVFALYLNKNIAFSLPVPAIILYPILAIVLFVLLWIWLKSWVGDKKNIWPYSLIILGALSNIWDRLRYGGVVDYLNVPFFTVLNISDVYIFLGVLFLIIDQIKKQKYEQQKHR